MPNLFNTVRIRVLFFASIALICSIQSNGQDSANLHNLSERVTMLEAYKNEILDKKFENKSTELSNKIDYEVKKATDDIKDQLWILKITGGIITLLLSAGIGVLLYKYFVGLKKLADRLLKQKLEHHLSENSQYLIDIITSQKTENLIKKNKKLLVLSGDDAEKTSSEKLINSMGFHHTEFQIITEFGDLPDADLIIFANRNESIPEETILEFLEKSNDKDSFIFYGKRLNVNPQNEYADRINFANSKFTLYHQIINTLSFKEIFSN